MPQIRSSSVPNIHSASMLNRMWNSPPCRNMYVPSCQIQNLLDHEDRHQPQRLGQRPDDQLVRKKSATLAPMSAFIAVERGPGPKENEDA